MTTPQDHVNLNVIVLHGWNDKPKNMKDSFDSALRAAGFIPWYVKYDSSNDHARMADFSEMLQKKIEEKVAEKAFVMDGLNFLTHSTGALVLRKWLREEDSSRLGNIVMLAPPNFGSPLASLGKSLKGRARQLAITRSWHVGKSILDDLELGSELQWYLAEADILNIQRDVTTGNEKPRNLYGEGTSRLFIITGAHGYSGLRRVINKPGTDGTIVVAGANLDARLFKLEYGMPQADQTRATMRKSNIDPAFSIHVNENHTSITDLSKNAHGEVAKQVVEALRCPDPNTYRQLKQQFRAFTRGQVASKDFISHKQILFRLVDQHRAPTPACEYVFEVWRSESVVDGYVHLDREQTNEEARYTSELNKLLERNKDVFEQGPHHTRYLLPVDEVTRCVPSGYTLTLRLDIVSQSIKIRYRSEEMARRVIFSANGESDDQLDLLRSESTTLVDVRVPRESDLVDWFI